MRALSSRSGSGRFGLIFALGVLAGCDESDAPDDDLTAIRPPEIARIVAADEALTGAHIPTVDPASMTDAEIEKALGTGPHCEFRYTSAGKPVLAWKALADGSAEGVVKLNGYLVILRSAAGSGEVVLTAGDIRMIIAPDEEIERPASERHEEATSIFELGSSLRVGYGGYYRCVD